MKYWKEKENSPVNNIQFWTGKHITKLAENEIFLYGSNPQGINGAGAAKAAMSLSRGAKHGIGRGFNGSNAYALVTKSLNAGFLEKSTGILYDKEGYNSVSPEQIRKNIDELYEIARSPEHKDKKFLVSYQYETWDNGSPKKSLNGYTSQEMLEMFAKNKDIPPNIVFHESYKPHLEKLYKNQNKQYSGELVFFEDGKTVDIKEEDIIWTIDSDERNPTGIHGAGAAKDARAFGAKIGVGRGLCGQTYALVTKNLEGKEGFVEPKTGITYHKSGYRSVSPQQICDNIDEMYVCARNNPDKKFIVTYSYEIGFNGTPKTSLNGYNGLQFLDFFVTSDIPPNVIFHESYKQELEQRIQWTIEYEENERKKTNPTPKEAPMNNPVPANNDVNKGFTFFFSLHSPFSNFHPAKFTFRDIEFTSSEQFMMYSKAKMFGNHDIAQEILDINNKPLVAKFRSGEVSRTDIVSDKELSRQWNEIQKEVKAFGRKVKNYDDKVWSEKRFNVVAVAAREKFSQNEDIKEILLNTGNTYMIEASPYDKIWGIGLSEYDAKRTDPARWPGMNILGKVLDMVKEGFFAEIVPPSKKPKP